MWIPGSIPGATNFSKTLVKTLGTLDKGGGRRVKKVPSLIQLKGKIIRSTISLLSNLTL